MNHNNLIIAFITGVLVFLQSCGGGGGNDTPFTSGVLNPELSGHVFVDGNSTLPGQILDLSTGMYSPIPGMEEWDQAPDYSGIAFVAAYPSRDGSEVVETVQNCKTIPNSLYKDDCVIIRNKKGDKLTGLTVFEQIEYSVRLSSDRQHIAFAYDE